MRVSIVIPVYNEEATIEKIVERVLAVDLGALEREIICVDDCSTDATATTLAGLASGIVRVIRHPANLGKGAAVRTGLARRPGTS